MEKDLLVILMIAFGIFAVVMFILFYVYLKKYYNDRHIEQDYENDIIKNDIEDDGISSNNDELLFSKEDNNSSYNVEDTMDDEFMPIKKK